MNSRSLALFTRAMRSDFRSPAVMWARFAAVLVILVSLAQAQAMSGVMMFGAPGKRFFSVIATMNLYVIALAGLSYFASAITEEKEEQVLGLLKLTGLSPVAILLGKSTSRLCGVLILLLVQFPFTLLAVTLGGVTWGQIVAVYVTLAAFAFFLANLAMLWSVICRRTMAAATLTGVTLLGVFWLPGVVYQMATWMVRFPGTRSQNAEWVARLSQWLTLISPGKQVGVIMTTGWSDSPWSLQVVSNVVLGMVWFGLAWLVFNRFTMQDTPEAPVRSIVLRRGTKGSRVPAAVAGLEAITWKEWRFTLGGWSSVVAKFILGVALSLIPFLIENVPATDRPKIMGGVLLTVGIIGIVVELAFNASRVFKHEVRWKTLSALATLPYPMPAIAYRKVWACVKSLSPYLGMVVVGTILYDEPAVGLLQQLSKSGEAWLGLAFVVISFVFFLHLTALLSLYIKRGALPLAVGIFYIGGILIAIPTTMAFRDGEVIGFVGSFVLAIGAVVLHVKIGRRLTVLAAQE